MDLDYYLERRLFALDSGLHRRYSDCVVTSNSMLSCYQSTFPSFTDHTVLHTMNVIDFCNRLCGDQINRLTADDIYVLLMGCLFHDVGMGVSRKDYESFQSKLDNPSPTQEFADIVRNFHHELSALYVEKYWNMLEIPSEAYAFAIMQICRGHRKTDLKNAQAFPRIYPVGDERVIHLSYLAPLLCLADELDIATDRNISFLFDKMDSTKFSHRDVLEFGIHQSIRSVELDPQAITVNVQCSDASIQNHLVLLCKKLEDTLRYCRMVVATCSDFAITQETVRLVKERK